jgi:hypothetical protein
MRLPLAAYRCVANGHSFRAPALLEGYGTHLLRSRTKDSVAIAETITDPAFSDLRTMLEEFPEFTQLSRMKQVEVLQSLFGLTCDPDAGGTRFMIDAEPCCPYCGDCNVVFVESIEPPEFAEVDIPNVTHDHWYSMSTASRKEIIQVGLTKHLRPRSLLDLDDT